MSKNINLKKQIKVAVQMDSLDKINKKTDSTLALIEEANKRGYAIFIYTVENLYLDNNKLKAKAHKVLSIDINKENYLKIDTKGKISLNTFDFILIRQDPPFDMQYITSTYLLEKLPSSCKVLNNPSSIRNCPEKLFVLDFYHLMPPTLISKNIDTISNFVKKFKKVVIKPLYGNGGSNVFFFKGKRPQL